MRGGAATHLTCRARRGRVNQWESCRDLPSSVEYLCRVRRLPPSGVLSITAYGSLARVDGGQIRISTFTKKRAIRMILPQLGGARIAAAPESVDGEMAVRFWTR